MWEGTHWGLSLAECSPNAFDLAGFSQIELAHKDSVSGVGASQPQDMGRTHSGHRFLNLQ